MACSIGVFASSLPLRCLGWCVRMLKISTMTSVRSPSTHAKRLLRTVADPPSEVFRNCTGHFLLPRGGHSVEKGSHAMSGFQNLSGTLANYDARRHRVAGCDARHNGTVSDTKIVNPVDLEGAVHHRHRVMPHLGSTCLVPITAGRITDEVLECSAFEIAWHHLPLDEGA